jgi:hypothetical protein
MPRRRAYLRLQKIAVDPIACLKYFVFGPRTPSQWQHLPESVQQTLREGVESQRIKAAGMVPMATFADPRREIAGGVPLETYREDALWRSSYASLQHISGSLSQQLCFAGAGTGDDRSIVCGANYLEGVLLEFVDTDGAPVFRPDAAG